LEAGAYALIIDNNAYNMSSAVKETVDALLAEGIPIFESPFTFIGSRLVWQEGALDFEQDEGEDLVVISDENRTVVDRVTFDTSSCGENEQDVSLERRESLGASDCTNFDRSPAKGGSPGKENANWILNKCDCDIEKPRPMKENIIITEIKFNPVGESPDEHLEEWIEILNNECMQVDLSGWSLGDGSEAGGLTPYPDDNAPMTLDPGFRAVIIPFNSVPPTPIPDGTRIFKVGTKNAIGSGINNGNDVIKIFDDNGSVIDEIRFSCVEKPPPLNCGSVGEFEEGETIERTDALDVESFQVSEGSPGLAISGFQNAADCS